MNAIYSIIKDLLPDIDYTKTNIYVGDYPFDIVIIPIKSQQTSPTMNELSITPNEHSILDSIFNFATIDRQP